MMGAYIALDRKLNELTELIGLNDMKPEAALEAQIERYRQMTGEQRLEIALRLHELACDVSREGIRAQFPGASDEEVERHLRERIRLTYEL